MAMNLEGAWLSVAHTIPPADARLQGAWLSVAHTVLGVDARLEGAWLSVAHTIPPLNARLEGTWLSVAHTVPPPLVVTGLQGLTLLDRPLQGLGFGGPNRFIED